MRLLFLMASSGNGLGPSISMFQRKSTFLLSKSSLDGRKTLKIVLYYWHRHPFGHANKLNRCSTSISFLRDKRRMLNRLKTHLATFLKKESHDPSNIVRS